MPRLDITNMKINATGLFPDPDLNNVALEFLNQYWEPVYRQAYPQTKATFAPIVVDAVNKIFGRVPFKRLMPKE